MSLDILEANPFTRTSGTGHSEAVVAQMPCSEASKATQASQLSTQSSKTSKAWSVADSELEKGDLKDFYKSLAARNKFSREEHEMFSGMLGDRLQVSANGDSGFEPYEGPESLEPAVTCRRQYPRTTSDNTATAQSSDNTATAQGVSRSEKSRPKKSATHGMLLLFPPPPRSTPKEAALLPSTSDATH